MTKVLAHYLVGYDKETERVAYERVIPDNLFRRVKEIADVDRRDPDAVASYELSWNQVCAIADLLGCRFDLRDLDYFLDAYSEDENTTTAAQA